MDGGVDGGGGGSDVGDGVVQIHLSVASDPWANVQIYQHPISFVLVVRMDDKRLDALILVDAPVVVLRRLEGNV